MLESQESVEGDESALDGAGRQGWCTWVLESTRQGGRMVGCMRIGRTWRALEDILGDGLGGVKDGC